MAEAARKTAHSHKLAEFNWEDPFLIDEQLSEDERLIRDTARQYAQEKLQPRVAEAYLEEKTERGIFNEMGELGPLIERTIALEDGHVAFDGPPTGIGAPAEIHHHTDETPTPHHAPVLRTETS